jgi:hypothetical protein
MLCAIPCLQGVVNLTGTLPPEVGGMATLKVRAGLPDNRTGIRTDASQPPPRAPYPYLACAHRTTLAAFAVTLRPAQPAWLRSPSPSAPATSRLSFPRNGAASLGSPGKPASQDASPVQPTPCPQLHCTCSPCSHQFALCRVAFTGPLRFLGGALPNNWVTGNALSSLAELVLRES